MAICFVLFFYRVFLLGFANKKETAGDRREIGPFYRVFQPSFRGGGTSISSAQRQQCSSLVLASFLFVCVCVIINIFYRVLPRNGNGSATPKFTIVVIVESIDFYRIFTAFSVTIGFVTAATPSQLKTHTHTHTHTHTNTQTHRDTHRDTNAAVKPFGRLMA